MKTNPDDTAGVLVEFVIFATIIVIVLGLTFDLAMNLQGRTRVRQAIEAGIISFENTPVAFSGDPAEQAALCQEPVVGIESRFSGFLQELGLPPDGFRLTITHDGDYFSFTAMPTTSGVSALRLANYLTGIETIVTIPKGSMRHCF